LREKEGKRQKYLGPSFSDDDIEQFLRSIGAVYDKYPTDELVERAAAILAQEKVLGPFLLDKRRQPALRDDVDWRKVYQLD